MVLLMSSVIFAMAGCSSGGDGGDGSVSLLDTTFNNTGYVMHDSAAGGSGPDHGSAVNIDADGKLVVAGRSYAPYDGYDMTIWRYESNGTLDTTFNGVGYVTDNNASGGSWDDSGQAVVLDADGKIVVVGYSSNASANHDMTIWRYNSDGTRDYTFNGIGYVTFDRPFVDSSNDEGYSVVIAADGKIVVAGKTWNTVDDEMTIWRYNSDGTPDYTFNGEGYVTYDSTPTGFSSDRGNSVAIDANGKIVVAGTSYDDPNVVMTIWRYESNGALDTTFNGVGYATFENTVGASTTDEGNAVVIDADGKIVVAGRFYSSTNYDMGIWRYDSNGSLDTTFNDVGYAIHDNAAGGEWHDSGQSVAIDPLGRIIVTGRSSRLCVASGLVDDMAIWRYNGYGTLDTTFNGKGYVTYDAYGTAAGAHGYCSVDYGSSVTVDANGKIVVSGGSYNESGNSDMTIWRYRAE